MFSQKNLALVTLFIQLEHAQRAGVSILRTVEDACSEAPFVLRRPLTTILDHLRRGGTLSEGMAFFPYLFDDTLVSLVRTGEKTGRMPLVLNRCADLLNRRDAAVRRIRKAVMPGLISMIVILALSAFFFSDTGGLRMMACVGAAIVLFFLGRRYARSFRYVTDVILLHLPLPFVRKILTQHSIARFAETLSLLYQAGVPLRSALEHSIDAVPNLYLRQSFADAVPHVINGERLYDAFRGIPNFTGTARAMLKAGEDSGNLSATLNELAEYYNKLTEDAVAMFRAFIGPAATIVAAYLLVTSGGGAKVFDFYGGTLDNLIQESSR